MAATMVTNKSFPSSNALEISFPRSESGTLTSSLAFPSESMRLKNPYTVSCCTSVSGQLATYVVDGEQLVLGSSDVGDLHVVGGGRDILELLAGENLECQL